MQLFKDCKVSIAIAFASKWCIHLDSLGGSSITDLVKQCLSMPGESRGTTKDGELYVATIFYFSFLFSLELAK